MLDKLKQVCLYSDCYGKVHWHRPAGIVSEDLVRHLMKTAELFAAGRDVTAREMELWAHHMGPVRRRSHGWQRKALANWYAQLQAEGLAPQGENVMANFIWGVEQPDGATPQPDA